MKTSKKNPITFAWWKPGQYDVSAAITSGGSTQVITQTFVVTAPHVRDVNTKGDGVVAEGSYKDQGQMIRLADKSDFNKDGMYMNFVVAGDQSVPGTLAGIQLACNQRVAEYNDGQFWKLSTNGTFVLDVGATNRIQCCTRITLCHLVTLEEMSIMSHMTVQDRV